MDLSRRGFLQLFGATVAVTVVPPPLLIAAPAPITEGIHVEVARHYLNPVLFIDDRPFALVSSLEDAAQELLDISGFGRSRQYVRGLRDRELLVDGYHPEVEMLEQDLSAVSRFRIEYQRLTYSFLGSMRHITTEAHHSRMITSHMRIGYDEIRLEYADDT